MKKSSKQPSRRELLKLAAATGVAGKATGQLLASSTRELPHLEQSEVPAEDRIGHPILDTLQPVIREARDVRLHESRLEDVASWMAYEELPFPDFRFPLDPGWSDQESANFIFLTAALNFAFTDFSSGTIFTVRQGVKQLYDAEAMIFCLARAIGEGIPLLQSEYLSGLTDSRLSQVFSGNIPMPLLQERAAILRRIGSVLTQHYQGSFLNFLREGKPRLYDGQAGLLDRLTTAFTSFEDEALYRGHRVRFRKRAQLLMWQLHTHFSNSGVFKLEDPEKLTAFADYIVPVALRVLGITSYSSRLEETIQQRRLLEKGGSQEVEIRAFMIWGCHLLTQAINRLRPTDRTIVAAQLDSRLWTQYHAGHWPHHLTQTTAY